MTNAAFEEAFLVISGTYPPDQWNAVMAYIRKAWERGGFNPVWVAQNMVGLHQHFSQPEPEELT